MHVALDAFGPPWPLLALPRFLCRRWFIWWTSLRQYWWYCQRMFSTCDDYQIHSYKPMCCPSRLIRTWCLPWYSLYYCHRYHRIWLITVSIFRSISIRPYTSIFCTNCSPRFILYQVLLVSVPVPFVFSPAVSPHSCIGSTYHTQLRDRRTTNAS